MKKNVGQQKQPRSAPNFLIIENVVISPKTYHKPQNLLELFKIECFMDSMSFSAIIYAYG